MKTTQAYGGLLFTWLLSAFVTVTGAPVVIRPTMGAWNYGTHPYVATVLTIAWGAACVAKGVATCAVAGVAALLLNVAFSFRTQSSGQQGGAILPVKSRNDGSVPHQVWHDTGDGHVKDFLDTSSLKAGVDHVVWDNKGNVFTATKHPKTNDNVLVVHLGATVEDTGNGHRVVKPEKGTEKRDTDATVESFAASWNYSGSVYEDYTQDDANADARQVVYDMFAGTNDNELIARYDCSTLTPTDGGDEKAIISITPQGDGLPTEIEPACGA